MRFRFAGLSPSDWLRGPDTEECSMGLGPNPTDSNGKREEGSHNNTSPEILQFGSQRHTAVRRVKIGSRNGTHLERTTSSVCVPCAHPKGRTLCANRERALGDRVRLWTIRTVHLWATGSTSENRPQTFGITHEEATESSPNRLEIMLLWP